MVVKRWIPAVILLTLIFLFSSIPGRQIPSYPGVLDILIKKGGHLLGYGSLALAFRFGFRSSLSTYDWLAWILSVIYGITDEFHQSFIPGRYAAPLDVVVDAIGAGSAILIVRFIKSSNRFLNNDDYSSNSSSKSESSDHSSDGTSSISENKVA